MQYSTKPLPERSTLKYRVITEGTARKDREKRGGARGRREKGEGKEVWDGKGCLLEDEEGVES